MKIPDNVDFAEYIELVGELEAQEIHTAGHWREKVLARAGGFKLSGDTMPWSKTDSHVRLREGELSIWAGINGHRKSMFLGQVMVHLAKTQKVAIASLEMHPEETLFRMCCQSAGVVNPSEEYIGKWIDWADERIVVYDQLDKVAGEKILGFTHYCAKVLGCKHIVIDSLTKCGIASDDRNGEKDIIDRLQWAAKTLKCHVHLVAHVRKPHSAGEEHVPSKFDVRGASELVDLCDNCFLLWKDKKREEILRNRGLGFEPDVKAMQYLEDSADQKLIVSKQRHGAFEGTFKFWVHDSMQFMSEQDRKTVMVDL